MNIKKLHSMQVELLDEFDRICNKHGLRYCIMYGTLLGAVRHKGCIPWDDDTDVVMPRDDFEKFKIYCCKDIDTDRFFFQCSETDVYYPEGLYRLRRNNTLYVDEMMKRRNYSHLGVWLDIFPLDNVKMPNSYIFKFRAFIFKKILNRCAFERALVDLKGLPPKYYIANTITKIMTLKAWIKIRDSFSKLDQDLDTKYCVNFYSAYNIEKEIYLKSDFENPIKMEYEGKWYYAPRNWEKILKQLYGDYMTPPPQEKRKLYHEPIEVKL